MFNTTRLGRRKSYLAWLLVMFQFLFIGIILLTSPLTNLKLWVILFILLGIALGLYAIYTIRIGNFNISPHVKPDGIMIAHGPYRFIRHPMYTAILVTCWPLVLGHFDYIRLICVIGLTIVLIVKLHIEEQYLTQAFGAYREYTGTSKKLIPFIW
jgi:protein-S-isoprenylcysteine O-methyltransferase Ste14